MNGSYILCGRFKCSHERNIKRREQEKTENARTPQQITRQMHRKSQDFCPQAVSLQMTMHDSYSVCCASERLHRKQRAQFCRVLAVFLLFSEEMRSSCR